LFALITVCLFIVAVRTGPGNISVGKKLFGFFVIILFGGFFNELAFIVKCFKNFRRSFVMCFIGSSGINIKRNSKFFKRCFNNIMIFIDNIFRCAFFVTGFYGNGNPMLVGTSDKNYFFAF